MTTLRFAIERTMRAIGGLAVVVFCSLTHACSDAQPQSSPTSCSGLDAEPPEQDADNDVADPPVREMLLKYDDGLPEAAQIPLGGSAGTQLAVRFSPPGYPARVKDVSFFVTSWGVPDTPFRIRLYSGKGTGAPIKSILTEDVRVQAEQPDAWLTVDLTDYDIVVEEGEFFVAMEWLVPAGLTPNTQSLGTDETFPAERSWVGPDPWIPVRYWGPGDRNQMIRARVEY